MHRPPSVRYPVGHSRIADRLIGICWMAGAGCSGGAATHLVLQGMTGWRVWVPCAIALLSGLLLWRSRRRSVAGELAFDGEGWSLSADTGGIVAIGHARVCLDLQDLVLLRLEGADRSMHWLWLDRDADLPRWRDLRRVLYADVHAAADDAPSQGGRAVFT